MTGTAEEGRLWDRLMALGRIGAIPGGGVDRQALTEGEIDAWRRVIGWGRGAGLEPATDIAGNLFLTLPGRDRTAAPLLLGSHLDTQPAGGRFDGAAGVLAALEAVTALAERGHPPERDCIVVAWMNEEGSRFAPGMMGSEAFCGVRGLDAIRAARDADGTSVGEALDRLHDAFPDLPRRPLGGPVAAYLELHIEQGPVLEAAGCPVGIVTGIQGKKTYTVCLSGAEGHAGTLAMAERRDAVAAFARCAAALHAEIGTRDRDLRFTIGRVQVAPNAPSVIPAEVRFSIDLRHPDNAVLDAAGARITPLCAQEAAPCAVTVTPLVDAPSNVFDATLQRRIGDAAKALGIPAMPLLSAAGHDARHLAGLCPSAMIFIPCRGGISHAPSEWAEPAHVAAGAAVLARVLDGLAFAETPGPEKGTGAMNTPPHPGSGTVDMADLPVQFPHDPGGPAQARARFFNSGNAFNIKKPPVPGRIFTEAAAEALAPRAPTGLIACDQAGAMDCASPATTPLMLARYATIAAGERLPCAMNATGSIWYVISGSGKTAVGDETLHWSAGDVLLLPGGPLVHVALRRSVLWVVSNEPQLAYDASQPPATAIPPVHYPASEIERQLALITASSANASTSGLALIFSSDGLEAARNILPSLTLSLNTLPGRAHQRAHRHNSAAITLVLSGPGCFSMVDGARCDWSPWATLVTPPGAPHSHHNEGEARARFLIVQDGGLHYHARTMGFAFLEGGDA